MVVCLQILSHFCGRNVPILLVVIVIYLDTGFVEIWINICNLLVTHLNSFKARSCLKHRSYINMA